MQCACPIISYMVCPALQYFPTLSHKRHNFLGEKSYWTQKVCFDFFYKSLSEPIFHSKKKLVIYNQKTYIGLQLKYPLFLSDCKEIWIDSTYISKNTKITKFHYNLYSVSQGVPCGQTQTKLRDAIHNFAKWRTNKWRSCSTGSYGRHVAFNVCLTLKKRKMVYHSAP